MVSTKNVVGPVEIGLTPSYYLKVRRPRHPHLLANRGRLPSYSDESRLEVSAEDRTSIRRCRARSRIRRDACGLRQDSSNGRQNTPGRRKSRRGIEQRIRWRICGSRGEHDCAGDHANARAFLETGSSPGDRVEQFLAGRNQGKNERGLEACNEAGGRSGDVDCAIVRCDRHASGGLAAPPVKLLVEQQ